jgi:hypothetical protein
MCFNPLKYIDPNGHCSVKANQVGTDWVLKDSSIDYGIQEYVNHTKYTSWTKYYYKKPKVSFYQGEATVNFLDACVLVPNDTHSVNHGFNDRGYNDTFQNVHQTIPNQKLNLYGDTRTRYQKNEDNGLNKAIRSLQKRHQYIRENPSYSHQKAQRLAVMWSVATVPMAVVNAPKIYGVGVSYIRNNPNAPTNVLNTVNDIVNPSMPPSTGIGSAVNMGRNIIDLLVP